MDLGQNYKSKVAEYILVVGAPIIFVIGVIGNSITITVLSSARNKKSSTTVYLTFLAVADLVIILTVVPRFWATYVFKYDIIHYNNFFCKSHMFTLTTAALISSFLLVALTFERLIGTTRPHKVKVMCTTKNAYIVSWIVVVMQILINAHLAYGFGLSESVATEEGIVPANETSTSKPPPCDTIITGFQLGCIHQTDGPTTDDWLSTDQTTTASAIATDVVRTPILVCGWSHDPNYIEVFKVLQMLTILIDIIIPVTIFIVSDIMIIGRLSQTRTKRPKDVANDNVKKASQGAGKHVRQITLTLVSVNIVFIVCKIPAYVFILGSHFWIDPETGMTEFQEVVWVVVNTLYFINFAINFIMYVLIGEKFRSQVVEMLCFWRRKEQSESSGQTASAIAAVSGITISAVELR